MLMNFEATLEAAIDGSSTAGKMNGTMTMKGKGTTPDKKAIAEFEQTVRSTEERSAEK
jgi:hypothetical protein